MTTKNLVKLVAAFSAIGFMHNSAFAEGCKKNDIAGCFTDPNLSWAQEQTPGLTAEMIFEGPASKPELTPAEQAAKTIFCKYVYHKFDSPGSAKFKCARTNQNGMLFDEKGNLNENAVRVTTEGEQLTLNGQTFKAEEGVLVGLNNEPLTKTTKDGKVKLLKGDVFKIKYFVSDAERKQKRRGDRTVNFNNQELIIRNAFENSPVIENTRWTEVFTEVAATRLFWAMGLPADVMIPLNKVVCLGCDVHPKDQTKYAGDQTVSIFNVAVMERRFAGKTLGKHWNLKDILQKRDRWSANTKAEYDVMHLTMTAINYFNGIPLQTRIVCLSDENVKTENCSRPAPFFQDVGSSFGAEAGGLFGIGGNSRGDFDEFTRKSNRSVMKNAGRCEIKNYLSNKGPGRNYVAQAGLDEYKRRMAAVTDDILLAIYKTARFELMEPKLTAKKGAERVLADWVSATRQRINQVMALTNCPQD